MCTSCKKVHSIKHDERLNILVGTRPLHNLHNPRSDSDARMEPDPFHIEWLTVCDATVDDLYHAWKCDYSKKKQPMRVLLCGGLDDIIMGKSVTDVIVSILRFQQRVLELNSDNEFVAATLPNPPSVVWFPDNGPQPRHHQNLLPEIKELNSWVVKFNEGNGKTITPRLHRFGVRDGWSMNTEGKKTRVKRHIMSHWCSDPILQRSSLIPRIRMRLGVAITRHFKGEMDRHDANRE